ncbi:MAG: LLM class F420-dependent oxidoreductase [Streptosporangiaceae bacterium]
MKLSAVVGMWLDRPAEEALHTASLADQAGYDELWIGEMATWDTFALATAVGLATERIRLTLGPFAVAVRGPVSIAMGAASVAALTRREVGVAIGTSSTAVVEQWHGRSRARSGVRLEESAQALRGVLAGDRSDFAGELIQTSGFRLRLDPPGGSLTVAAFGPSAVTTAARHADRMVINLVSPDQAATLRASLDVAAARAGRPAPVLAAWVPAAVDPAPEAYAQLVRGLVPYLAAPGYGEMFTAAGFGEAVTLARKGAHPRELLPALPPEITGVVGLVGDLASVRARLAEYAQAGVDEVAIVPATGGDPGGERTLTALGP